MNKATCVCGSSIETVSGNIFVEWLKKHNVEHAELINREKKPPFEYHFTPAPAPVGIKISEPYVKPFGNGGGVYPWLPGGGITITSSVSRTMTCI